MPVRKLVRVGAVVAAVCVIASCRSDVDPTTPPAETTVVSTKPRTASEAVAVVFDSPGADPRPLRETSVAITAPVKSLRMTISDLTYRGVVCGFTLGGTRPASPLTISISGTIPTGTFESGPVQVTWTDDGAVSTANPASSNGWSFSADAYPSRNGPGWAVSIGAVTGEGENVIPSAVTCALDSSAGFVPENGPVGYWAGFATR
jgi:hypothetical protein